MNPQISYGEDVISRIHYTNRRSEGRKTLQWAIVETLNHLIGELTSEAGCTADQIVDAVVVGNTAMHHLFADLPVSQLGASPYVPAVSEALELYAVDLGLDIAPGARVYIPPNIAGFVGADHVAMLLSARLSEARSNVIALDIGTNTEISLASGGRIVCCSCASGPAFEGAHIRDGMRAAEGAIERVWIDDGRVRVRVIGDIPPTGICGSGILDAVAQLHASGTIDRRGNFQPAHPLVRSDGNQREVALVGPEQSGTRKAIGVTRSDVNEIQLAKGAIRAGIDVLLSETGLADEQIDEFIVAGAFGTYLSLSSAVQIGMFPHLPHHRFRQIGNAAGAGARQLLVSKEMRKRAEEIAHRIEYVELTTHPKFSDLFFRALMFE